MEKRYTSEQREAIDNGVNLEGLSAQEVSDLASVGELCGLDAFDVTPANAARCASFSQRDRVQEAFEEAARAHPEGLDGMALTLFESLQRDFAAFMEKDYRKPSDYTQWSRALTQAMSMLEKARRSMARDLGSKRVAGVEGDDPPEPSAGDNEFADALRAEHAVDGANGSRS